MIIIENGSGVAGANSYASVEHATSYHADRENDAWEAAGLVRQEAALIKATDRIEATYRAILPRLSPAQGLQWPQIGDTAVPGAIAAATMILALYALDKPLVAPLVRGLSKTTKKLDGVGEITQEFDDPIGDPFPLITSLLAGVAELRTAPRPVSPGRLTMGRLVR